METKRLAELFARILREITDNYVMNELTIPENVLALKDEACGIIEKAARGQNAEILGEYEHRLCEIYDELRGISRPDEVPK